LFPKLSLYRIQVVKARKTAASFEMPKMPKVPKLPKKMADN
jgi:hypothetical protein